MIYVVSGYMRTGTSMMMRALEEGGMDAVYRQSRDVMKNHFADEWYDPNIGGLYELERREYLSYDFPLKFEGKLIKALNTSVGKMVVMPGIRAVYMRRDREEVRQSYAAFFSKELQPMAGPYRILIEDNRFFIRRDGKTVEGFEDRALAFAEMNNLNFQWAMERNISIIKNRRDVLSCDVFWYRDVVGNPLKHFQILEGHGWPIDVEKAAGVVDSKYCRFKKEHLTIGVL